MISPEEFSRQWFEASDEFDEGLVILKETSKHLSEVSQSSLDFLSKAGLPSSAAPFLSFDCIAKKGLQKVFDTFGTKSDYSEECQRRLSSFLIIGYDGAGNPIAIDTDNACRIVMLDHEDNFNSIMFLNSSIPHLAEFLVSLRNMVDDFINSGRPRDQNGEIPIDLKEELFQDLNKIDSIALETDGWWRTEIGML